MKSLSIFTLFYTNRKKYWVLKYFRLPIFDDFTYTFCDVRYTITLFLQNVHLSVSMSVCQCVCVCEKTFVVNVAQELIHGIP